MWETQTELPAPEFSLLAHPHVIVGIWGIGLVNGGSLSHSLSLFPPPPQISNKNF